MKKILEILKIKLPNVSLGYMILLIVLNTFTLCIFAYAYFKADSNMKYRSDINRDGVVDIKDFSILMQNFDEK